MIEQPEATNEEEMRPPAWTYGMFSLIPTWGPPKGPCHICQKRGWPGMSWRWTGREWKCDLTMNGGHDQEIDS